MKIVDYYCPSCNSLNTVNVSGQLSCVDCGHDWSLLSKKKSMLIVNLERTFVTSLLTWIVFLGFSNSTYIIGGRFNLLMFQYAISQTFFAFPLASVLSFYGFTKFTHLKSKND